jgi:hypothetical protein
LKGEAQDTFTAAPRLKQDRQGIKLEGREGLHRASSSLHLLEMLDKRIAAILLALG